MNVPLSLRTRFDRFIEATLDACPECGGALHEHEEVVTKQQIEIVKKPYIVKEYHVHSYTCPVCEREWEEEYFRFIEAGIEATNNPAELTIRQSILDRVVTQGSRGPAGNEWHERFWSVFTTCGLQNIPVMNYLKECLSAYFGMRPSPGLVNPAQ